MTAVAFTALHDSSTSAIRAGCRHRCSLVAARKLTYVNLPTMARRSNVEYEEHTYQEELKKGETLGRLEIRMVLQGDYEGLRQFIHELERAPEFIIIDELSLTELAEGDRVKLSLGLSTYFQRQGNGD